MTILTNLSVTGRWLQYNGKINNIGRSTLQICCTDQIFFQSTTSRPFYSSSRCDSSVCGIPTLATQVPKSGAVVMMIVLLMVISLLLAF